ncbi:hypothetical protein DKX38_012216 [Salix brachista]|uniref:Uncharacterized protein n=1 Tax=Salix brachista TaxID=2182728 RepID=A0A5N5LMS4_9ROSI|nr:hypothetical protein DKX38_012216 [Salix brachista]
MAVGFPASHGLVAGATFKAFLAALTFISRGDCDDVKQPDFEQASLLFPPRNSLHETIYHALVNPIGTKTELLELVRILNEATALYDRSALLSKISLYLLKPNMVKAWVTLDEERVAILERDPEFRDFPSQ